MYDERLNDKMKDTKPDVAASAVERLVSCNGPDVLEGMKKAMTQLAEWTDAGRKAIIKFGVSLSQMAEEEYLKYHAKLPGSNRTKRLRKKRMKVVGNWFCKHLSQNR